MGDSPKEGRAWIVAYPKFLLLFLTFVLACLIFRSGRLQFVQDLLSRVGYAGVFAAGVLYVYGFTAAPATALLLMLARDLNPVIAVPLAGAGAVLGDLVIYKLVRDNFQDEIQRLSNTRSMRRLGRSMPIAVKKYLLPVLGSVFVATPLPDEIGITLLAASSSVKTKHFIYLSFILNTLGILAVVLIGWRS